jgi:hypothetical protein
MGGNIESRDRVELKPQLRDRGSASATTTSKAVRPPAIPCTLRGQGRGERIG